MRKAIELVSFCGHPSILNFCSRGIILLTARFFHSILVSVLFQVQSFCWSKWEMRARAFCPYMKVDTHFYLFLWSDSCIQNINKMDVLFGSSFAQLQDVGKPFTRCGHTRRYLQLIMGPPPRLYNKTTETVYPLPIGGEIKQWTGRHCPVPNCHFELCLYNVGNPARTFP